MGVFQQNLTWEQADWLFFKIPPTYRFRSKQDVLRFEQVCTIAIKMVWEAVLYCTVLYCTVLYCTVRRP